MFDWGGRPLKLNATVAGALPEGPQRASVVRLFSSDDVVQHNSEAVNVHGKAGGMSEAHEFRSHVCRGAPLCRATPHQVSIHIAASVMS